MKKFLAFVLTIIMLLSVIPLGAITVGAETYNGFTYTISNGEVTITKCDSNIRGKLDMPTEIEGYPVKYIDYGAFSSCLYITIVNITDLEAWCNISFKDSSSNPLSKARVLFINDVRVSDITIPAGVTSINEYAFYDCDNITSVTIPDSVTSIGDYAFYDCANIKSVTIPDSVTTIGDYAFTGCKSLTSLTIPDSVKTIGAQAFSKCGKLTSVSIPDSVTSVGSRAFYDCENLTRVDITDLAAWCTIDFAVNESNPLYYAKNLYINNELVSDIVIPEGATSINSYAFNNCNNINSVTMPNSVTSIGNYAFANALNLSDITISNNVTDIGYYAFYECDSLTNVIIPDSVINMGENAFESCSNLESVIIGDGVTKIARKAFDKCSNLSSVTIGKGVKSMDYHAFYSCRNIEKLNVTDIASWCSIEFYDKSTNPLMYSNNIYVNDVLATDLIIPDGVANIANYAFYECDSLTSVTIPSSVTSIGEYAFYDCDNLAGATMEEGVTSIGLHAFDNCTNLKSVTLPDSLTSLGNAAFHNCCYLENLIIGNGITNIGNSSFAFCQNLTSVIIPEGVTSIGRDAFSCCSKLKTVTIPVSVNNIGESAFYGCSALIEVYYAASKDDKAKITIGDYNEKLLNAAWRCAICEHVYDNDCDADCNDCGKTRSITHNYEWVIDQEENCGVNGSKHEECSVCHTKRSENTIINATGNHVYDNACDSECNVCGETRKVPEHTYKKYKTTDATTSKDGKKYYKCSVCGKTKTSTIYKASKVYLSTEEYTYNGKTKKPSVKVYDSKGKKLTEGEDYKISRPSSSKKVGKYKIKVTFKGDYTGTKTLYYTINPKGTKVSSVTAAKKSLKVKIVKQSTGTTGYQIQYSTSSKFKSAKTKTISSYKTTSYTIKSLKAKKNYYVRVRTYKTVDGKKYYSDWSKSVKKKTK